MTISPSVITSKAAMADMNKIKSAHANILEGMASQQMKMVAYNQQKNAELQAKQTMQMQMDKEKTIANTQAQKDAMDFSAKQAELDIKRAALTQM
jgi:hypothetical protein